MRRCFGGFAVSLCVLLLMVAVLYISIAQRTNINYDYHNYKNNGGELELLKWKILRLSKRYVHVVAEEPPLDNGMCQKVSRIVIICSSTLPGCLNYLNSSANPNDKC